MNKTKPQTHYINKKHTRKILYDNHVTLMKKNKKRNHKYTRKIGQSGGENWLLKILNKRKVNTDAVEAANTANIRKANQQKSDNRGPLHNASDDNLRNQLVADIDEFDEHENMLQKLLKLKLDSEQDISEVLSNFNENEIAKIKEIGRKDIASIQDYCGHINTYNMANDDECHTIVLNISILAIVIKEKEDKKRIDDALKTIKDQGMKDALSLWKLKKAVALQEANEAIEASARENIEIERVRHDAVLKEFQNALEYANLDVEKFVSKENDRLQKNQQKSNVDLTVAAKAAKIATNNLDAEKAAKLDASKAIVIKNAYKRKIAAYDKKVIIRNIANQYLTENMELKIYLKDYNKDEIPNYTEAIKSIENSLKIYPILNIADATDLEIFNIEIINYSIEQNINIIEEIIRETYNKKDLSLADSKKKREKQIAQDVEKTWGMRTGFVLNIDPSQYVIVNHPKSQPKPPIKPPVIEASKELEELVNTFLSEEDIKQIRNKVAERNTWLEQIANDEIKIDNILPRDEIFIIEILNKPLSDDKTICKYIEYSGVQINNNNYCNELLKKIITLGVEIARKQSILINKNILLKEMRHTKISTFNKNGKEIFALLLLNNNSDLLDSKIFDLYEQYKKNIATEKSQIINEKTIGIINQFINTLKQQKFNINDKNAFAAALSSANDSIMNDKSEEKSPEPDQKPIKNQIKNPIEKSYYEEHKESDSDSDIDEPEYSKIKEEFEESLKNDFIYIIEEFDKIKKMETILENFSSVIENIKKIKDKFKFSKLDEIETEKATASVAETSENFKHFYNKVYSKLDNKFAILNNIQNPLQAIIPNNGQGSDPQINLEPEEKIELKNKILNILKIIPILKHTPLSTKYNSDSDSTATTAANLTTKLTAIMKALKSNALKSNKGDKLDEQYEAPAIPANLDLGSISLDNLNNINSLIDNTFIDVVFAQIAPIIQDQSIIDLLNLNRNPEETRIVAYNDGSIISDDDSDLESDVSDVGSVEDPDVITRELKKKKEETRKKVAEIARITNRDAAILKMKNNIEDKLVKSHKHIYYLKNLATTIQNELQIELNNLQKLQKKKTTPNNQNEIQTKIQEIQEIRNKITANNIELDVEKRKAQDLKEKYYYFCDSRNPQIQNNQHEWFEKTQTPLLQQQQLQNDGNNNSKNIYGLSSQPDAATNAKKQAATAATGFQNIIEQEKQDKQQEIVKRIIYKLLNLPPNSEINKNKFLNILEKLKTNTKNSDLLNIIGDAQDILKGDGFIIQNFHTKNKELLSSFSKTIIHPGIDVPTKKATGPSVFSSNKIQPTGSTGPTGPTGPNMCDDISKLNENPFKINYSSMFDNMYKLNRLNETIKIRSVKDKIKVVADKKKNLADKTRKTAEHKAKIENETTQKTNAEYWKTVNEKRDNKIRADATAAATAKLGVK
jgi:hypothetical protein